ncbi:cysteine dioxygenase [Actinokineospora bangkokensis]|uniref:Cysteine dioxygenase n=1 Tax=Actinokineospora bangkokensis TaxID=1193682 RepID=A0A1Q9LI11_9PSEU|nr:cysteine dioxygenase family protein [Actinokineospora bangkokensis]OLR91654.1 cysteine dioxygenase [Actinokineospora bangkokensis]
MTTSLARSQDIHPTLDVPRLHELIAPRAPVWTAAELRDLTATTAEELAGPLRRLLAYTPDQRWWARIALTDEVELWLLSWLPGQGTAPHDHGGASGSFAVLEGEVAETYRYPSSPIRHRRHTAGSAIGFGAGRAHEVRNVGTAPAATVHAYSPPLVPTREYATLADVPAEIPSLG